MDSLLQPCLQAPLCCSAASVSCICLLVGHGSWRVSSVLRLEFLAQPQGICRYGLLDKSALSVWNIDVIAMVSSVPTGWTPCSPWLSHPVSVVLALSLFFIWEAAWHNSLPGCFAGLAVTGYQHFHRSAFFSCYLLLCARMSHTRQEAGPHSPSSCVFTKFHLGPSPQV